MAVVCDPITQQAEARGGSQGPQPGLHCELKASLGYTVSFKNTKTKSNHTKKPQYTPWFHFTSYRTELASWQQENGITPPRPGLLFPTPQGMLGKAEQRTRLLHIQNLNSMCSILFKSHKILRTQVSPFGCETSVKPSSVNLGTRHTLNLSNTSPCEKLYFDRHSANLEIKTFTQCKLLNFIYNQFHSVFPFN